MYSNSIYTIFFKKLSFAYKILFDQILVLGILSQG